MNEYKYEIYIKIQNEDGKIVAQLIMGEDDDYKCIEKFLIDNREKDLLKFYDKNDKYFVIPVDNISYINAKLIINPDVIVSQLMKDHFGIK